MELILASSSIYRQKLLTQINIHTECIPPNIDETPQANEQPHALALRLAMAKAATIAKRKPDAIVIGSDQVASIDSNTLLGKPGNTIKALEQLKQQSGKHVIFYTALCIRQGQTLLTDIIPTQVKFRNLSDSEIERYIDLENPIDCAGSFKSEGLGITLFESLTSDDPSALIGLPLIRTAQFLRELGVNPLQNQ